jgi:hypothetical protein
MKVLAHLAVVLALLQLVFNISQAKTPTKPLCRRNRTFVIYQPFNGPLIEANGAIVANFESASTGTGQRWPLVGDIYDSDVVGFGLGLCTRLNEKQFWYCEGIIQGLKGCVGNLNAAGYFNEDTNTGEYTITGGTGDFLGAKGNISHKFSYDTGYSVRTVSIVY